MVRSGREPEVVTLSLSNWIGLAVLLCGLVGSAWAFTLNISGEIRGLQAQVHSMDQRLQRLETK